MPQQDYYSVLNISPYADANLIKKAFRKLAFAYHPDTGNSTDLNRFLLLQEAYETLIDSEKRNAYDELFFLEQQGYYKPKASINLAYLLSQQQALLIQLQKLDTSRLDMDVWLQKQLDLLSPVYVYLLTTAEPAEIKQYYTHAIKLAHPLPSTEVFTLYNHWQNVPSAREWLPTLFLLYKQKKRLEKMYASLPWLAAITTLALCIAMYILYN